MRKIDGPESKRTHINSFNFIETADIDFFGVSDSHKLNVHINTERPPSFNSTLILVILGG